MKPNDLQTSLFPAGKSPSSGFRTPSPSCSPATPLRTISAVPFSWETLPGVPKKQASNNGYSLIIPLLPLPPSNRHVFPQNGNKKMIVDQRQDPFFAALVECSRQDRESDNVWRSNKVSRALRFGVVSCKNTCAVSESIVYLPRSSRTASSYDRIDRSFHRSYYHQ